VLFLWLPLVGAEASSKPFVVKVLERTKNISPADAPYNDCDFTMKLEVLDTGKKHIAIVPMFRNRIFAPEAALKTGQIVKMVKIVPKDNYIQLADDLQQIEYEYDHFRLAQKDGAALRESFQGLYDKIPQLRRELRKRIDLYEGHAPEIRDLLKGCWERRDRRIFDGVNGEKGFYFISPLEPFNRSFRHYAKPVAAPRKYYESCLRYLTDMNAYLKSRGVPLVVIICPVYDELFFDELLHVDVAKVPFINHARALLIEDCLKNGIIAVDILPVLLEHRSSDSFLYYYNTDNLHISPLGSFLSMANVAQLAEIPARPQIAKQIFYLNSRFLKIYRGSSLSSAPQMKKLDRSVGDILVAGDSMSLEGYGFPNSARHFFNANVETISMPSRSGEILAELRKKEEASQGKFLKRFSVCFFIMNGNYINTFFKTDDLMGVEVSAQRNEAVVITAPAATMFDGRRTKYRLPLNSKLCKASELVAAVNIPEPEYVLYCSGKEKVRCDITGFSGPNIYPACFRLSREEFASGDIELSVELPVVNGKSGKARIANITIAPVAVPEDGGSKIANPGHRGR